MYENKLVVSFLLVSTLAGSSPSPRRVDDLLSFLPHSPARLGQQLTAVADADAFDQDQSLIPTSMVLADMNQDGIQDLILGGDSPSESWLRIYAGSERFLRSAYGFTDTGEFIPPFDELIESLTIGSPFDRIISADFDADGRSDLLLVRIGSSELRFLARDGKGSLSVRKRHRLDLPIQSILAENAGRRDGIADLLLVIGDDVESRLVVAQGRAGQFFEVSAEHDLQGGSGAVLADDLDGDGLSEVAVAADFGVRLFHGDYILGRGEYEDIHIGSPVTRMISLAAQATEDSRDQRGIYARTNAGTTTIVRGVDGSYTEERLSKESSLLGSEGVPVQIRQIGSGSIQLRTRGVAAEIIAAAERAESAVITRLNLDANPDLVFIPKGGGLPRFQMEEPAKEFEVNTPGNQKDPFGPDGMCELDFTTPELECTWDEAVQEAEATAALDLIKFTIPEVTCGSGCLASLNNPIIIDGDLDGGKVHLGAPLLTLRGVQSTLLNVRLDGRVSASHDSVIAGSEVTRIAILRNGTVEGVEPNAGNTISSPDLQPALTIGSGSNVLGNQILCVAGANCSVGISVGSASDITIGGPLAQAENEISGFVTGIGLGGRSNTPVGGVIIAGNNIHSNQIGIQSGSFVLSPMIGGETAAAGNTIQNNTEIGVYIFGEDGNILNNVIRGNLGPGIQADVLNFLQDDRGLLISGNDILSNGGAGIMSTQAGRLGADSIITIRENSISENRGLGIDWKNDGVSANDAGDSDLGPSGLQNYPELILDPETRDIDGTLRSKPNQNYRIEVFSNDECDSSGHGEGLNFEESFSVQTDGDGNVSFVIGGVSGDRSVTVTATDSKGNTSEFSACATKVDVEPFIVNSVGDEADENAEEGNFDGICSTGKRVTDLTEACDPTVEDDCECTLRGAIQEANARQGEDRIHFGISTAPSPLQAKESFSILPSTPLLPVVDPVTIDGFTQEGAFPLTLPGAPGGDPDVKILIDIIGSNIGAASGLTIATTGSRIRGLRIRDFGVGVKLPGGNNTIEGNSFEVNGGGILIEDSTGNTIGGERLESVNFFVRNRSGVLIGVNAERNTIVGNNITSSGSGVVVAGRRNDVRANLITEGLPEAGLDRDETGFGIVFGPLSVENKAQSNIITHNFGPGILVNGSRENMIGGRTKEEGNEISSNWSGVLLRCSELDSETVCAKATTILSNRIFNNQFAGIAFHSSESYLPGPPGTGANDGQSFPKLFSATSDGKTTLVRAKLKSTPDSSFDVQLFANDVLTCNEGPPQGDPPLIQFFSEGESFIGTRTIETNLVGNGYLTFRFDNELLKGRNITATATSLEGSTSAFSSCLPVVPDEDGDGISDLAEASGPNGGDSNDDGILDGAQENVAHVSVGSSLFDVSISTDADSLVVEELISPFEAIDRPGFRTLLNASKVSTFAVKSTIRMNSPPSGGAVPILQTPTGAQATTLTLVLSESLPITSYFNFGPTPDNPEAHLYEFLFDETTGAEFLEDRILLHFVDGQRGDHDLTVNGVIETLGVPSWMQEFSSSPNWPMV